MTEDEKPTTETVEVVKDEADQEQFDATKLVNMDPNKKYRWARAKDVNVARHKFNGYSVVDSTTDRVRSVLDDGTRLKKGTDIDTAVRWSDMILMSISKEKYDQLIRRRDEKIQRQTRGVSSSFKRAAAHYGQQNIRAYEEHRDNPQMRGMSEKSFNKFLEEKRREEENKRR